VDTSILDDSPVARGIRLKKIRGLAGLSAEELAKKIGCSRQTISYWENATYSGLSHKGARKVILALRESGIHCEIAWLLYGIGNSNESATARDPFLQQSWQVNENTRLLSQLTNAPLLQEISLFKQLHENALTLRLDHDIESFFETGNWVGGYLEKVEPKLFGKLCIISLEEKLQIKILQQGKLSDTVQLQCPYHLKQSNSPVIKTEEIHLEKAAQIIRIWK